MPNVLDGNGLQVNNVNEVTDGIVTALKSPAVYGPDINTDPNSPDGQAIGIFAQFIVDMLETLVDVYNMFFVDHAYGVALDSLVALNGIARRGGTYTVAQVTVAVGQAVTLTGLSALDSDPNAQVFTVADDSGNQYYLETTKVFGAAGSAVLSFRAKELGQTQTLPNTIENVVTSVLGVLGVNNPPFSVVTIGTIAIGSPIVTAIPSTAGMLPGMEFTATGVPIGASILSVDSATQVTLNQNATANTAGVAITVANFDDEIGGDEETDAQLKVRRIKSFKLGANSVIDSIRAQLLELPDVSDAYVVENNTGATVDGILAHYMWVIVNGGTAAEIAEVIYEKKSSGCGMMGAQNGVVDQLNGGVFTGFWDNAIAMPLYVKAQLYPKVPGKTFDLVADAVKLATALDYKLGQNPNVGDVIAAMQVIEPDAVLIVCQVSSDNITYESIVSPTTAQYYFTLAAANIFLTQ